MKTKIRKFGVEIEGEFSSELYDKLLEQGYGTFKTDGSISRCSTRIGEAVPKGHRRGRRLTCAEYVTRPLLYNEEGLAQLESIITLLQEYKDKKEFHYNYTMGLHIHFSFNHFPSALWSIEFVEAFRKRIQSTKYKLGKVYEERTTRLNSGTNYCKKIRNEKDLTPRGTRYGDRYQEINFRSAYDRHGTIEFRVFPSTNPKTMRRFFYLTVESIEGFLKREKVNLSKTFEFEVSAKRRITKTETVLVENGEYEELENKEVVCRGEKREEEYKEEI